MPASGRWMCSLQQMRIFAFRWRKRASVWTCRRQSTQKASLPCVFCWIGRVPRGCAGSVEVLLQARQRRKPCYAEGDRPFACRLGRSPLSADLPGQEQRRGEARHTNPLVQVFRILCHARQGRAGLEPHSRPRAKPWLHPSSSNLKRVFRRPRISGMSRLTRTWRGRPTAPLSILPPPCCASNPAAHLLYHRDHQKSFDFVIVVSAWHGIS